MRAFIVLCLVAVACADQLGYNYRPVDHSSSGLSFSPGSGSGSGGLFGSSSNDAPAYSEPAESASYSSPSYSAPAELEKEYYSFSADENDFNDPAASEQINNSVKKGLRVVFIKGPENRGFEDAALNLAKQAAEQKTAIYVLNKQPDLGDLANKFNAFRNNRNNRPEVHFVKYRTPEDAANAQHQIQSEYDRLGGSAQNINGGIAPVINFASRGTPVHSSHGSNGGGNSGFVGSASSPSASYLPASILRRLRRV